MLDHGLEIVAYALKLRQSHLLPAGAAPEDQAAQSEVWTAAVAYAVLLHDIGKIAVDIHVELLDGTCWHPWHGTLQQPYRFRYREGREYRLHSAATGLLTHHLLTRDILDWLSGYPDLWASLLYVLAGAPWANSSPKPTAPRSRKPSAATPLVHWPHPKPPCNANCSTACALCSKLS